MSPLCRSEPLHREVLDQSLIRRGLSLFAELVFWASVLFWKKTNWCCVVFSYLRCCYFWSYYYYCCCCCCLLRISESCTNNNAQIWTSAPRNRWLEAPMINADGHIWHVYQASLNVVRCNKLQMLNTTIICFIYDRKIFKHWALLCVTFVHWRETTEKLWMGQEPI